MGSWPGSRTLQTAFGVLSACLGLSLARVARADDAAAPRRWYGWQTLVTDGAGVVLIAASSVPEGHHSYRVASGLVGAGLTTLVLGAPVVHAAHGRWGAAAGSLALRTLLPALAYVALNEPCSGECSGPLLLAVLAVTAPVALDAAALSWETTPASTDPSGRARQSRRASPPMLVPYATAGRHQLALGVRASF